MGSMCTNWETGQSYPYIELPPRIAVYSDMTVDVHIGYEPLSDVPRFKRIVENLREVAR